jgi:[ribosomal protein S18]-alanine N-acetyltransferase
VALNKAPQPYLIARLKPADLETGAVLDAVMEIERLSFKSPWSRQVFAEEIARTWAHVDVIREGVSGQVVAFCNYWLVADEVHLLNLATHPQERRGGHGSRLLAHVIDYARRADCRLVTLEVRRSNESAQRLYRRFAFKAVAIRPKYYVDDDEDAVIMSLELR